MDCLSSTVHAWPFLWAQEPVTPVKKINEMAHCSELHDTEHAILNYIQHQFFKQEYEGSKSTQFSQTPASTRSSSQAAFTCSILLLFKVFCELAAF